MDPTIGDVHMSPVWPALSSIAMSVGAQFALKRGMSGPAAQALASGGLDWRAYLGILLNPYVVLGLGLYALGAVVWLSVLARWDVSKAYPLVGLGFAMTLFVGLLAGETVTLQRGLGVAAICVGVWLVSQS
jgi:drug/metabolite transporter (DMT)-like permease